MDLCRKWVLKSPSWNVDLHTENEKSRDYSLSTLTKGLIRNPSAHTKEPSKNAVWDIGQVPRLLDRLQHVFTALISYLALWFVLRYKPMWTLKKESRPQKIFGNHHADVWLKRHRCLKGNETKKNPKENTCCHGVVRVCVRVVNHCCLPVRWGHYSDKNQ